MDRYQRALEEYAEAKRPSSPEIARIQQAARRAVSHRRPLRRGQLFFAYGGWAVAALAAGMLVKTLLPVAPRGLITQDPSLVEPGRLAVRPAPPAPPPAASAEETPSLAPVPHCTPQIRAFAPSRAQALQPTTFTLSGTCLPASLHLLMPDCTLIGAPQRTDTAVAFTCTPTEGSGKRSGLLRERPDGPPLFSFVYDVVPAPGGSPALSASAPPAASAPPVASPENSASVAQTAPATALPPLPRQRAAHEELLRASKAHLFRLEAVHQVTQDTRAGVKSAEEQACLDQKLQQLTAPLREAQQHLARLEAASQANNLPVAEQEAELIAVQRRTADHIYLQAQRCLRLDD
jgi:hypothetical protein